MNNQQLDQLLQDAQVPEPEQAYWARFPSKVLAEIRTRQLSAASVRGETGARVVATEGRPGFGASLGFLKNRVAWAAGAALVLVVIGFVAGSWHGRRAAMSEPQLASMQKYFHEIEGLFPNQVRAIVVDGNGPHLLLSERANVPASNPVYVKICGATGCKRFITFSGQQIQVNGEVFDVLVDRQGDVLLVGGQWVWSSSQPAAKPGGLRIEARPLTARS